MKYNGFTNVGSMYQAKCKANELPIKFVKVKVGNGLLEETEDPAKFIDVKSLKKEVVISEKTQIEDAVRLTIQMDNDGVTEGYFPREFGIYVEDEGVEVLYWYVNDGNEASYLPSQSTAPVKLKNHFNIIATTLESLVVNWSGKEFWVDKEYLEKKMEVNGNLTTDKINGLAGGYNGTFPLISAIKDNIYLLPATNKFYVCIENYSGSSLTVPNANFEELSVFQNRNKLENLFKNPKKIISVNIILTTTEQSLNLEYEQDNIDYIIIRSNSDGRFSPILVTPFMFKDGWLTQTYGGGSVNPANFRHINMRISENKLYYTSVKIDSSGVSQNSSSGIILEIY